MTTPPEARYSLIIPAYNEEHRIAPLFDAISGFEGELIVVCDGQDGPPDLVDRIAEQRKDLTIRCLRFGHRLGKGGGVIAGLRAARSPLVGYFDADGSTSIEEMERLFSVLSSADGAIGSRWIPGSILHLYEARGVCDRLEEPGIQPPDPGLVRTNLHDTQCGAKVFRKSGCRYRSAPDDLPGF